MIDIKHKDSAIIEELFNAGSHFGFVRSRRHPSAKPFIFGVKNRVEIFDLEKTSKSLLMALEQLKALGASGASVLFVGGKGEARVAVKDGASALGMPYVDGRWIGGTITNFTQIRKRVLKLEELTMQKEKGELAKYTKRERSLIDKEIENLKRFFEGLIPMKELPKALFVVDSKKEDIAIKEAQERGIPVIALCGSDCDISSVDYAIPGNDASVASIKFIVQKAVDAYRAGKSEKSEVKK